MRGWPGRPQGYVKSSIRYSMYILIKKKKTKWLYIYELVCLQGTPVVKEAPAKKSAADIDEAMERERQMAAMVCSLENKEACMMCSG